MARHYDKERFDIIWRPLVGVGIVFAFGVQTALPYVNPMLVMILAIFVGTFYHMSYTNIVENAKDSPRKETLGVGVGMAILGLIVFSVLQANIALEEIRPQCERLKKELLEKADSTKADTYNALKCPNYNQYEPFLIAFRGSKGS